MEGREANIESPKISPNSSVTVQRRVRERATKNLEKKKQKTKIGEKRGNNKDVLKRIKGWKMRERERVGREGECQCSVKKLSAPDHGPGNYHHFR